MRVMVFVKTIEDIDNAADGMTAPTPDMLEAFAAMDRFIEELAAGRREGHRGALGVA